jgi:CheY-like chemotaxis protein
MQLLLESIGHRVTAKNNGPEALVAARLELPDVILLDIGLPGMDGYELARRLRAMPENAGSAPGRRQRLRPAEGS